MANSKTRKIVTVFLASPGDLEAERRIARRVAEETNQNLARRLGFEIDLRGWEDTLPNASRPQSLINRDVEDCDVFLGLLWERWGSSTGDGKFGSGFEEEFNIALTRHRKSKQPEIRLFFKAITENVLRDPGPQAERVLAFRRLHEERKEIFYREFILESEWETLCRAVLSDVIWNTESAKSDGAVRTRAEPARANYSASRQLDKRRTKKASLRVRDKPVEVKSLVEQIPLPELFGPKHEVNVAAMMSKAAVVTARYLNDLPSVHITNFLYKHRKAINARLGVGDVLFAAHLESYQNGHRSTPGWFWGKQDDQIENLSFHALFSFNVGTRAGALKAINLMGARLRVRGLAHARAVTLLFTNKDPDLLREAIAYFERHGPRKRVHLLSLKPDIIEDVRRDAEQLALLVQSGDKLKKLMNGARSFLPNLSERLVRIILSHVPRLGTSDVRAMLGASSEPLVSRSLDELKARGVLSADALVPMLAHSNEKIRALGVRWLVDLGKIANEEAIEKFFPNRHGASLLTAFEEPVMPSVIRYYLHTLSEEQLVSKIHWVENWGEEAYRVLGEKYPDRWGPKIRSDLHENFSNFERISKQKFIDRFPLEGDAYWESKVVPLLSFLKTKYTLAGVKALQGKYVKHDMAWARVLLEHADRDVKLAASEVLAVHGENRDVRPLLRVSTEAYSMARLVQIASSLSDDPAEVIAAEACPESYLEVFIEGMSAEAIEGLEPNWQKFLRHDREGVRQALAKRLTMLLNRRRIEQILNRYTLENPYYYNVPYIFDLALYAPRALRESVLDGLH